jgi:radical SAM superfamily enzyme YgiQ (UPF0313 family)
MKVLLISANPVRVPYYIYPLGLDHVAASLSDAHEVKIADVNIDKKIDSLITTIRNFAPEVIGISIRNIDNTDAREAKSYIGRYRELVLSIRKNSGATIVLGGSGFTIFPEQLMDILKPDYGIVGEGERMPLLLNALESGKDPSAIPGVLTGGSRKDYPPPLESFSGRVSAAESIARFYIAHGGMLNLQTKRGCTYNCIYCTYPNIEGNELRLIPPDLVANNAKALEAAGAKFLFITDSAFNTSYAHGIEVAHAFERKGVTIPWSAFFAPTKPPKDYYRILHGAGMTHAEFGTEALSHRMLASYQKPFGIDDVFAAHESALEAGLYAAHYLLLGGPGEALDTVLETLANAQQLTKTVIFFFCGIRIYPHTKIYEIALKEGQISEADNLLEPVFYQSRSITADEIFHTVEAHARGRENWFIGSGGNNVARLMSRMHKQGHAGPLWELMIR